MHNVTPKQDVRILRIEIAVPADAPDDEIRDEVTALLSERGIANPDSHILDWRYTGEEREVTASSEPEEGGIFLQPARIEFPADVVEKALSIVRKHAAHGHTDVWYSIAADVDLHVLVDEDGLEATLYPVVNGATVVDRCLPLVHTVPLQD